MTLEIEFQPDWKVGSVIRIGDGKDYKITKKTRNVIAYTRYYFWNRWWDKLSEKWTVKSE
jgi:hypothetical protein